MLFQDSFRFASVVLLTVGSTLGIPQQVQKNVSTTDQSRPSLAISSLLNTESSKSDATSVGPSLSASIYHYLKTCRDGLEPHVQNITELCRATTNENAEESGAKILFGLQGILIIFMTCALNIQSALVPGTGTIQSLVGSLGTRPTSTGQSFSLSDCATMYHSILVLIYQSFDQVSGTAYKYPSIRFLCADTLIQLSTCVSVIAEGCIAAMPNFGAQVKELVSGQVTQFIQTGFGFAQILSAFQRR